MQDGQIFHENSAWYLRWYNPELDASGKKIMKRRCKRLGPWDGKASEPSQAIRDLAKEILEPLNAGKIKPEALQPMADFIEKVYLPLCQQTKRPATYQSYVDLWKIMKPHMDARVTVREFSPVQGSELLQNIHEEKVRSHYVYRRLKAFLSGALMYAITKGVVVGDPRTGWGNPMKLVKCPKGNEAKDRQPYTPAEIATMIRVLEEPWKTIVLTAALTGLRKSEIQGLCWEDIQDGTIHVRRSIWFGKRLGKKNIDPRFHVFKYSINVGGKTKASRATVPISPRLQTALLALKPHPKATGWIFRKRGPMNLANIVTYHIAPVLAEHGIQWRGWHQFRHAVGTLLNARDVKGKTIQSLLRHSQIATTMNVYVHPNSKQARAAVAELDAALAEAEASVEGAA
jgi:integrase